ncbi:MAG TPA: TIM barrel protein [Aggregatilineales bacterium]|nr:TIM barrel protein [Aggregatilineales bacterium]
MTTPDALRFGTVGAPSTTPKSGTPFAIEHTKQLGLGHLEIAWVQSVRVTDESCAEIKRTAEKYGISLSIHAPYYINLNSQTVELMDKSDERLLAAARKGFLAGAKEIVFHPGSYHGQPPEQVYERAKEKMIELTTILREEGTLVNLRPETMGKSAMFGNLDEVLQLSKEVEGVLPCIDWAHLHARRGDGSFNSYAEFDDALKKVREMLGERGIKTLHSHMSGIAYGAKGEKEHLPLNEADFRYKELMQAFVDNGVEGSVGVEAPEPFHVADCLTFQATYRRLMALKAGDVPKSEDEGEE